MVFLFYLLAIIALATGTAAIYMALIQSFSVKWLYYHYFISKPIVWAILVATVVWVFGINLQTDEFPIWTLIPLAVIVQSVVLTYKMHQEKAFREVDFSVMSEDISSLPLRDDMQLGVIEYGGVTKAYPLDYVIHHHIINDRFGERIVALTYCAMCRSIIPLIRV